MLKKETIPKGSVALLATRGWLQKWGRSGRYSYTVLWKTICALPSFKKLNFLKSFHHVLSDIKLTQHIRKTAYESSPIWWQEFNGRVGWMTVTCWTHRYCSQLRHWLRWWWWSQMSGSWTPRLSDRHGCWRTWLLSLGLLHRLLLWWWCYTKQEGRWPPVLPGGVSGYGGGLPAISHRPREPWRNSMFKALLVTWAQKTNYS